MIVQAVYATRHGHVVFMYYFFWGGSRVKKFWREDFFLGGGRGKKMGKGLKVKKKLGEG